MIEQCKHTFYKNYTLHIYCEYKCIHICMQIFYDYVYVNEEKFIMRI
jgi:hypothetical protein